MSGIISRFFGSWWAVFIHVLWFGLWFYFELDVHILTNAVSLEAIFLVIILLMYSNRLARRDDARDEADLQADIKSEEQIRKVKQMIIELRKDLKQKK